MAWKQKKLEDLLTIKHGFAFKGEYFGNKGTHIVVTPGNFFEKGGFRRTEEKDKWYFGAIPEEYILKKGDLIIAMTEQGEGLLGSSAMIPSENIFLHNQRIGLIKVKNEQDTDKLFLYYLFNSPIVRNQIRATASGTKVRHTAPGRVYEVSVSVPELNKQHEIATLLLAYDSLVENNNRRIKILEEMAQKIYTEWFVAFHFPGYKEENLGKNKFPIGWKIVRMGDLADFINGYAFKPRDLGEKGLPVIKIPELRSGVLAKTPYNTGERIPEKYRVRNGDILFSWSATLLVNIWSSGEALLNQHLFKVVPKKESYYSFLYFTINNQIEKLRSHAVGATMQHLRREVVVGASVLLPNEEVLIEFEDHVSVLLKERTVLIKQNEHLVKMRDLLIPQLVTGKLEVKI